MTRLLLTAACLSAAVFASPAAADSPGAGSGVRVHVGSGPFVGGDHRGRDHRGRGNTVVLGGFGYSPDWAYYNNRSFAPDSFNDWWHDRPDRSLPRWIGQNGWVGQNGGCERPYSTGAGWRC
jgi:hypothetical protein